MIWKIQLSLLSQAKFLQKYPRFNGVTWNLALLLSRADIFTKIKLFRCHFKIGTCPVIARWSVHENKGPFYAFTLKYDLPLYCDLNFFKKCPKFNEVTWKFELLLFFRRQRFRKKEGIFVDATWKSDLPLLSRAKIFKKIRQVFWSNLNCTDYHGLEFSQ